MNMSPANKALYESEKESIHLILIGIGDEIYSTVDACQTAQEMWEAIERLAKNANPLALVATAQVNQDPYYQTPKSQKSYAPSSKPLIPTRTHTTTRYKGKEIAKPITPPSESASKEDSDPEPAQMDKDMQNNLALIANYMEKIQDVPTANTGTDSEPLEQNDQNNVESDDERVALANLIANLKLVVDENKKIQKQLKKANTTLAQELKSAKLFLRKLVKL
nr:hypothetical protein [Tanacetum cinerariifolium]